MQLCMHVAFTMGDHQVLGHALRITILVNQNRIMCRGGRETLNLRIPNSAAIFFMTYFYGKGGHDTLAPHHWIRYCGT